MAARVSFPSRWRRAAKIGACLDDIHRPVPPYGEQLARPMNSFFDRLTPARSYWCLNWTLLDRPDLHQPAGAPESMRAYKVGRGLAGELRARGVDPNDVTVG